jgi:protein-tyrosine-phosphatase
MAPLGYASGEHGPLAEEIPEMPSVLFVCTANICRSPMAVALFKRKIASLPDKDEWRVESAGTWGLDGSGITEGVRVVLEEKGVECEEHVARTVDREMLSSFDIILTMEKDHKEALKIEFPELSERIYLLSEMVGERFDVRDPIGRPLSEVRKTARIIEMVLDKGFSRICELAETRKRA